MPVSVYITSFNKEKFLAQAITSVLEQSVLPQEIIIVDDCSQDESREIIRGFTNRYPDLIKSVFNESNLGISKTRNIALNNCNNNIVTYLDGDDLFYPEKIKTEYKMLSSNLNYSVIYSNFNYIDVKGECVGTFSDKNDKPATGDIFVNTFCREYNVSSGNNYIYEMFYYNRDQDIGYYDDRMKIWEDWDFRIRMSKKYYYGYCPHINSAYRKESNGLHQIGSEFHFREQIKIYKKNKILIVDVKEEDKLLIINKVYAKVKQLFLQLMNQKTDKIKYFSKIYYLIIFLLTFRNRKSISTIYRVLMKKII